MFFHGKGNKIRASIVDPHGHYLGDALVKLRGLANFAADFGDELHRIEAIAEVDGELRVLDLKQPAVREAVIYNDSVEDLYTGDLAQAFT